MSERERWIVYPLLFLALGASLRDKIIKTTESQRIKCHGLMVFDNQDNPILVLGKEQFPEYQFQTAGKKNFMHIEGIYADSIETNSVKSESIKAGLIETNTIKGNTIVGKTIISAESVAPKDRVGELYADVVVAKNFVLTDGKNSIKLDGRYTVPLFHLIQAFQRQAGEAASGAGKAAEEEPTKPANQPNSNPAAEDPAAEDPAAEDPAAKAASPSGGE